MLVCFNCPFLYRIIPIQELLPERGTTINREEVVDLVYQVLFRARRESPDQPFRSNRRSLFFGRGDSSLCLCLRLRLLHHNIGLRLALLPLLALRRFLNRRGRSFGFRCRANKLSNLPRRWNLYLSWRRDLFPGNRLLVERGKAPASNLSRLDSSQHILSRGIPHLCSSATKPKKCFDFFDEALRYRVQPFRIYVREISSSFSNCFFLQQAIQVFSASVTIPISLLPLFSQVRDLESGSQHLPFSIGKQIQCFHAMDNFMVKGLYHVLFSANLAFRRVCKIDNSIQVLTICWLNIPLRIKQRIRNAEKK